MDYEEETRTSVNYRNRKRKRDGRTRKGEGVGEGLGVWVSHRFTVGENERFMKSFSKVRETVVMGRS